ncbi:hypothetical protein O181_045599 [Austropuccinia psidii MF-1]|uniref:Reverse transcriptase domain-containing protein n=1 Tax=Austropuccinia psidii MF-1 TaxID=1389203 RepID=A0A9Q3HKI3_9BASI|nr:hypothetical protein [Austropuccinia psidii MF-1]
MTWILQEKIPENVRIFIDDLVIKGPRSTYKNGNLEENDFIRFIWEYSVTLEKILFRIERAGLTISGKEFSFCVPALDIVGNLVSLNGRRISKQKTNKIQNWPKPLNRKGAGGLLSLYAYLRMFIQIFSQIALPLRRLTREDVEWVWDKKFDEAFQELKETVGEEMTLRNLDHLKEGGRIKSSVDSSYIAAGEVLTQEDTEGRDRPVICESITFSILESK